MCDRLSEKELIRYFKSLGLSVNTKTKARGHQGFYMKGRIDVSKNVSPERVAPTLVHEFAHYIHSKIEPEMHKNGGSLETLFGCSGLEEELLKVTNFVDENSLCVRLYEHKDRVKAQSKKYEKIIKEDYPEFQRSKKFKEFDKYIKKSKAKYLLKYDRVKVLGGFWANKVEVYTIDNIEKDFPEMQRAFAAFIRLKSCQRKQSRISARINRYQKYYKKPSELFARFAEGLYIDKEWTCALAPNAAEKFYEKLEQGYYCELKNIF